MSEVKRTTRLVSADGGTLDYVRDGEVLLSVDVPPGVVRAAPYVLLAPDGAEVQIGAGLVAVDPPHRIGIQPYGEGATDSAANPDFRPTSASRLEREMRLTLNKMKATTSRVEARERALAAIERVPEAPPSPEVIEPVEPAEPPAPVEPVAPAPAPEPAVE